jgi:hypothetical protein
MVVTDRLEAFLPRIQVANGLLGDELLNLEDVDDDQEHIEMVSYFGLSG